MPSPGKIGCVLSRLISICMRFSGWFGCLGVWLPGPGFLFGCLVWAGFLVFGLDFCSGCLVLVFCLVAFCLVVRFWLFGQLSGFLGVWLSGGAFSCFGLNSCPAVLGGCFNPNFIDVIQFLRAIFTPRGGFNIYPTTSYSLPLNKPIWCFRGLNTLKIGWSYAQISNILVSLTS